MYSKAYRILSLKHHDSTTQKYTELGTVIVQAIRADFKHNSSECDKSMLSSSLCHGEHYQLWKLKLAGMAAILKMADVGLL